MQIHNKTFTEPKIVATDDLNKRCYITFYFKNERVREYHGKNVGVTINPNRAKSLDERNRLLNKLLFEIHKALEAGNYPTSALLDQDSQNANLQQPPIELKPIDTSAIKVLFHAVKGKIRSDLSKKYKRNLKSVYRQFRDFLTLDESNDSITAIPTMRVETFLNQFSSSGTYYMNKRRDLGVLFSSAGRNIDTPVVTIQQSQKKKAKAKLHKPYERHQLKPILDYLKSCSPNLYVCCLLTYGSWLRPHEEVRLLTLDDFKKDWTEVHLSGGDNKGGNVRVVYIPDYVREDIIPILSKLKRDANIFSLTSKPLNEFYFNTAWSRAYKKMFKLGLIFENQTIYSFRHTAAIETYKRTKDVYLLQKLLGHSTILVTLKYLRSLGELNSDDLKNAAPQLY